MSYQPRWLAYAKYMSQPPDSDQLKGYEFIIWISQQGREYRASRGITQGEPIVDHDDFTRFLTCRQTHSD